MAEQLVGQLSTLHGVGNVVCRSGTGQEERALASQNLRVERRDRARSRAQANHQATCLQAVERAFEGVLAHAVEDGIHAHAIRQLTHALGHVFMAVVDGVIAAMGLGHFSLGIAGDRTDHIQAFELGPLRHQQAHATRCSVQQDGVALLEVPDAAHQVSRRQSAHGDRGCGFKVDAVWQANQRGGRNQTLSCVGTKGVQRAGVGHAIADLEIRHTVTHGGDRAAGFAAHASRQGRRIQTGAEISVGKVQRHSALLEADLTWTRFTDFNFLLAQHFGAANFVITDYFSHTNSSQIPSYR